MWRCPVSPPSASSSLPLPSPSAVSTRTSTRWRSWKWVLLPAFPQGSSTQSRKVGVIKRLLVSARGSEIKFLVRGLQGKLRVGLAEQSVLAALAHAVVLTPPSATLPPPVLDASLRTNPAKLQSMLADAVETVKQALSECPSYDKLIPAVLQAPIAQLSQICHLTPGIPVHPMLAKPTKGISEVLDRVQGRQFTCEYKYDGERAQVGDSRG